MGIYNESSPTFPPGGKAQAGGEVHGGVQAQVCMFWEGMGVSNWVGRSGTEQAGTHHPTQIGLRLKWHSGKASPPGWGKGVRSGSAWNCPVAPPTRQWKPHHSSLAALGKGGQENKGRWHMVGRQAGRHGRWLLGNAPGCNVMHQKQQETSQFNHPSKTNNWVDHLST